MLSVSAALASCLTAITTLAAIAGAPVLAQCAPQWQPGMGIPGVTHAINAATVWDSDGAGPLPPLLVLAGYFPEAGTLRTTSLRTTRRPAPGRPSAAAPTTFVNALAVAPNGDIVPL